VSAARGGCRRQFGGHSGGERADGKREVFDVI
jgi:hypothetical protein